MFLIEVDDLSSFYFGSKQKLFKKKTENKNANRVAIASLKIE